VKIQMKREEMLRRLKDGEDPLELSIEKWEDIVKHLESIGSLLDYDESLDDGAENCALCELYNESDEEHDSCYYCPVNMGGGGIYCHDSPFIVFHNARGHLNGMRWAARGELEFLRGLRKEE